MILSARRQISNSGTYGKFRHDLDIYFACLVRYLSDFAVENALHNPRG